MSVADLMRKSSHNPGCMRLSPASHFCQLRHVAWTSSAAAVWVSPAASRAALTSSLEGLAEGAFAPLLRFGWLGMELVNVQGESIGKFAVGRVAFALH